MTFSTVGSIKVLHGESKIKDTGRIKLFLIKEY
jgi:hypothetical protein